MKKAELGDILTYGNTLVEVVGIEDGRTIIMRPIIIGKKCDKCGSSQEIHVLENCANFQNGAEPVKTINKS